MTRSNTPSSTLPPPPPPPHSTVSAGIVPPPVSVAVEELAVIPEMSPISLDTTQRSLSSSKRPAFSQPRLKLRHDLGGDFVRNILSSSSTSLSPARPQVRSTHGESFQGGSLHRPPDEARSLRESSARNSSTPRYLQATNSFMKKRVSSEAAVRIRSQSASRRSSQQGQKLQNSLAAPAASSSSSAGLRRSYPSLGPNHSREMMAVGHSADLGVSHLEEGRRYPDRDESYPLPSPPIVSNGYIDAEMHEHEKAMGHESHSFYPQDLQDGDPHGRGREYFHEGNREPLLSRQQQSSHHNNGYNNGYDSSSHYDASYSHFVQSRQQQHGSRRSLSQQQRSIVDKAQQRLLQGEFSTEIYGPTTWMKTLRR